MKMTKLSPGQALILAVSLLAVALLACNLNPVMKIPSSIPAAEVIFTVPEAVIALATDKEENVYALTTGGKILKASPNGKPQELYSGLEICGFSFPAMATLPNGSVIVNECVDKKDTIISIDRAGNKTTLLQLERNIMSIAADAEGNVYLGAWTSEGNLTLNFQPITYLGGADYLKGQVLMLGKDGQPNTLYEGGIPLSIAVSEKGRLYAALWGQEGPFHPEAKEYSMCGPAKHFWIGLSEQVGIQQLAPEQERRSMTGELDSVSYIAAGKDRLFAFGEPKGGQCGLYQVKEGQKPQRFVFTDDHITDNLTNLAVSDNNLYFSDADGKVYRVGLRNLVVAGEASELAVKPSPTPAFTQPSSTTAATQPSPTPTATLPPAVSATNTPQPTPTPAPPSPTAIPPSTLQVTQLALYENAANHFAWAPDGKSLVIAGYNIVLYNIQTLKQTREIYRDAVREVVFSPDGTMLASAAYEGVKLWDVASWSELRTLAGSQDTESVAFSPDGKMVATATGSTVKLWDVAGGAELRTLPAGPVSTVAFSPDGRTLAAGAGVAGQEIKVWDVESGKELHTLTGHSNWINSVAFSPDGRTLASGSVDSTVRLWDVANGHQLRALTGHTNQVTSVAFSPDGRLLASASWDLTVKLWDVASGTELRSLTGHAQNVNWVAFSSDGTMLASGSGDQMRLWRIESGGAMPEPTPTLALAAPIGIAVPLSERAISPDNAGQVTQIGLLNSDWVRQLAWSPDGKLLAIATYHIYFYDAQTLKQIYVIDAIQWASSIAFSPDGTMLASASHDGVKLWEVGGWGELRTLVGSQGTESVAFSPNGRMLATATGSAVKLWDVASGNELRTLPAGPVRTVAFSPNGRTLAAGAGVAGQEIKLWDVESGNEMHTLTGHSNWINSVAFSPDGQTLASGSVDNTIRLWDVANGRQLRVFTGHTGYVTGVAFSPDGRLLASASWDLTVKLWDIASGDELRSLTGHTAWVMSVAFSPDGAILASGANDSAVRLWGLAP